MKRRSEPESTLIFDWSKRDGAAGRLFVAVLITLGAFIALFIGFRVITPESRPVVTRPQQVLVLNPDVPAERALIHQAMDRSFALLPTDGVGASLPAAAELPTFRPGIAAFELKLRPLTAGGTADQSQELLTLALDLPAPSQRPQPAPPAASPVRRPLLRALLEGEAASRHAAAVTLPPLPLVDPTRPRFRLAVGARGQVLMALPLLSSEDPAVMDQLRTALMNLRFEPAEQDVQWVQVGFRWEEAPAP